MWELLGIALYTAIGCRISVWYYHNGGLKRDRNVPAKVEAFAHALMLWIIVWLWLPVGIVLSFAWLLKRL